MKVRVDPTSEHLAMRRLEVNNPPIPNFGGRCHWVVSCMIWSCYPALQEALAFNEVGGWMDVRASLDMGAVNTDGMPEIRPCFLFRG